MLFIDLEGKYIDGEAMEVKFCCETKSKLLKHTQKLIELNYKIDLYQWKYLTNGKYISIGPY